MGVTYRGVAIGGPDDGKTLEHRDTVLKRLSCPLAAQVSEETGVGTYYFTSITTFSHGGYGGGEKTYGFWLSEGKTLNDGMAAVMARYGEERRHVDMLKRAGQLLHQAMREGVPGQATCEAIIGILNRIERELED